MQKVVTVELQTHYHKDQEEPFKLLLDQGWKVVSLHAAAAQMHESKAACWVVALLEKQG
jgi:hypothetical protein